MNEELLKEILSLAHSKAMSKSYNKDSLKKEASKYCPMTMMGVGHAQSIVKEIIEEYNLISKN